MLTGLELLGVTANLACVALTVRRHVLTWPAGMVAVTAFGVLFYRTGLYADALLQVFFFGQSIYGWWVWGRPAHPVPIRQLGGRGWAWVVVGTGLATGLAGAAMDRWTDSTVPYPDALASVVSLVANGLLARKVIDNWPLWIGVDLLYIGLFAYKALWATAVLYVLFIGLCVTAWREWARDMTPTA